MGWPLLCLCRPFCMFERCRDSNPESCRSKQARYQLSHPSPLQTLSQCAKTVEIYSTRGGVHCEKSDTWVVQSAASHRHKIGISFNFFTVQPITNNAENHADAQKCLLANAILQILIYLISNIQVLILAPYLYITCLLGGCTVVWT